MGRSVTGPGYSSGAVKLGFVTAILPEMSLELLVESGVEISGLAYYSNPPRRSANWRDRTSDPGRSVRGQSAVCVTVGNQPAARTFSLPGGRGRKAFQP
jgi:hypothetical protein